MTYQGYVIAAYGVFIAVLLWDLVAPLVRIAQLLRATRVLAARRAAQVTTTANGELER